MTSKPEDSCETLVTELKPWAAEPEAAKPTTEPETEPEAVAPPSRVVERAAESEAANSAATVDTHNSRAGSAAELGEPWVATAAELSTFDWTTAFEIISGAAISFVLPPAATDPWAANLPEAAVEAAPPSPGRGDYL